MEMGTNIFFITVLVVLAVIDSLRGVIPNKIVYPAVVITFAVDLLSPGQELFLCVLTAFLLAAFLAFAGLLQKKMGMGDVKLAFLIGLMTGLPLGFVALTAGIVLGGIAAIVLLASGAKHRNDEMPYGPYLASGAIITILFSSPIEAYIHGLSAIRL